MADPGEYAGTIRVYMVEPFSRWLDYVGEPYRFGFVGFSLNTSFELGPDGMFDTTVIWLPDTSGHANIAADNIAADTDKHPWHQGRVPLSMTIPTAAA